MLATHKMTYKIINLNIPEELSLIMPLKEKYLRIKNKKKLNTKPAWLSLSKVAKSTYRGRAYQYNSLPHSMTTEKSYNKFKKILKLYFLDKYE